MWYAKMYFSEKKEVFQFDSYGVQGVPSTYKESDGLLLDSREISKTPPYGTVGTTNQFNLNAPMKNRIDYIFVTKGIQVNKYGTLNECQYGHFSSDHFPIMIEAEF